MKPPAFTYHAPESVEEALDTQAALGPECKVLAGGQSLIPMLNMRLAAPAHLVDINRLTELDHVTADSGGVRVGALARHSRVEREAAAAVPLVAEALRHVAHPVIRNRGTTVGSLAHADPSSEMTAVLALLEGHVELASARGTRTVRAADYFTGPLESCTRPDELAVAAYFPRPTAGSGTAFAELARRRGDYAMCGVAALVTVDAAQRVSRARVAYLSMGPVPEALEVDLGGAAAGAADAADFDDAARRAVEALEPEPDVHATAAYRAHLGRVLTARVLRQAAGNAIATQGAQ